MLAHKCKNKTDNLEEKISGSIPVLGEAAEDHLGAMVPCHAETWYPGGTGYDNPEGF